VTSSDRPAPARALAIGAHPDDVEFGCGGTLAKWSDGGAEVHIAVLTDGSKGTWDAGADLADLVATRQREQQSAADRLGASALHWGGAVDGELEVSRAGVARVCELVRRIRPDVVLTHDPWRRFRVHPDHHAAGLLVVEGVVAARDPHFFTDQGLPPHRPEDLLLFETEAVDHVEGITGFVTVKVEALLAHRSQWRSTMRIADDPEVETARFARRVRVGGAAAGARIGLAAGEAFHRIAL
jgi:LmbE family N-acetylglucosaminyl deacetylase